MNDQSPTPHRQEGDSPAMRAICDALWEFYCDASNEGLMARKDMSVDTVTPRLASGRKLVGLIRQIDTAFARNGQGLDDDIETVRYTIGHLKATGHDDQTYIYRDLARVLRNLETIRKRSGQRPPVPEGCEFLLRHSAYCTRGTWGCHVTHDAGQV